jgi:mRNA-degrading endonuclease RelE of RelBE toxin-antitoxin system
MMQFAIADTFTESLARLTAEEQKLVKTAAFDLQMNPAHPSFQLHRLERAKDQRFLSARVNKDVRLIVHRSEGSLLLCYVAHHDEAYQWGERRRLETHPRTGAAQLVEIRERVEEVIVPKYVETEVRRPSLFAKFSDEELLGWGVPQDWLADVRAATEDALLEIAEHLPAEAAEALLVLATGGKLQAAAVPNSQAASSVREADALRHPDAQRRFRVVGDLEELERALDAPWDKWTVFLHPAQRRLVERHFNGPARVGGSAGTGKTIVALHRAVHLARHYPTTRVLLTTFSDTLAKVLRARLRVLIGNQPRLGEQIEVEAMESVALRLYERKFGKIKIASHETVEAMVHEAKAAVSEGKFSDKFLVSEWEEVVDAWQLDTWEQYREVTRLGRRSRLNQAQRATLWQVFEVVRERLRSRGEITRQGIFNSLAKGYRESGVSPFDFAVVDEAQDIGIGQLRFLAALNGNRPDSLFFTGDLGQRIFQQPFSWKALGVDIRGRSATLHTNYRMSHQIRVQADRLLGVEVADVDGNKEERQGTVSLFNGTAPEVHVFKSREEEIAAVAGWLRARRGEGREPEEMAVFVRSAAQLDRAAAAAQQAGLAMLVLDQVFESAAGKLSISTMHLAKGLEFRAVAVMACDDDVLPLQERLKTVADEAELEDVYNTERHLLYVACTRARDHLMVSSTAPASEFLTDLVR